MLMKRTEQIFQHVQEKDQLLNLRLVEINYFNIVIIISTSLAIFSRVLFWFVLLIFNIVMCKEYSSCFFVCFSLPFFFL